MDFYKLKKESKDTFYSPAEAWVRPADSSTKPEEQQFIINSGASTHMFSKKDLSSGELDTVKRCKLSHHSGNGHWRGPDEWRYTSRCAWSSYFRHCAVARRHSCRIVPWQAFAKNTVTLLSGPVVASRFWPKTGSKPSAKLRTAFPWLLLDNHRVPARAPPRHRIRRINLFHWTQQIRDVTRKLHETATRKLRETATSKLLETAVRVFPNGWHPHTLLMIQIRNVLQKLHEGSTIFTLTSRKDQYYEVCKRTKITRAPCRRRTREAVPREEKFGDLNHSLQRRMWISEQSSILRRSTRFSHPMDPVVSVQNENFLGYGKKFTKVSRAFGKAESHLYWRFVGIWQILWRFIMESLHINTSSIWDEWDCRKSSAQNKGRNTCSIVAIRSGWKLVGWFYAMLLLPARCPRPPGRRETPYERRFGKPLEGPIIPFWAMVEYHPISAKDPSRLHQFGKTFLRGMFLGYALVAGGIWKGDVLLADVDELGKLDASEIFARRHNANETITPKNGEKIIFLIAEVQ